MNDISRIRKSSITRKHDAVEHINYKGISIRDTFSD